MVRRGSRVRVPASVLTEDLQTPPSPVARRAAPAGTRTELGSELSYSAEVLDADGNNIELLNDNR
jgi:hypothetical protein